MLRPLLLLVLSLGLFLSCGSEKDHTHDEKNHGPETASKEKASQVKPPAEKAENARVKKILTDYYQALESEDPNIADFYAPVIQRFYSAKNVGQDHVSQSLKQSYKAVENRQVALDWESLEVLKQDSITVATFKGKTNFTEAKSGRKKTADFFNQITFDEELRILRYENASEAQKIKAVKAKISETGSEGLAQVVLLVSRAIKTGKFGLIKPFIHPDYGFFLIDHPGAFSIPYELSSIEDLKKKDSRLTKGMADFCGVPEVGELPSFTCETQFSKQGCFFNRLPAPYQGVTDLMNALLEAEISRFEQAPLQKAVGLEKIASHQLIDTQTAISLLFGKSDGKWCLLVIDTASYDCSA